MNPNKITTATIKKIVNGGYGLCRADNGKTILVRHCLPGETAEIRIVEQQKDVDYGIVETILTPHSSRISAPCPHYPGCGGCDLQHVGYRDQCSLKQDILSDLFERNQSRSVQDLSPLIRPVLPSPLELGYRQRIRLHVGKNGLGFNRFRSRDIVPIDHCLLAPENINSALELFPQMSPFRSLSAVTETIDILMNPEDSSLCLLFNLTRKPRPADRQAARALAGGYRADTRVFLNGRHFSMEGPFVSGQEKSHRLLSMTIPGKAPLTLFWEAGGFCQVNIKQNYNLISLVLECCEPSASDRLLDLYCGMGNFALPLAKMSGHVHAVESQGAAIRSGRYNSEFNGLSNIRFEKSDVTEACRKLAGSGERFDTIVCDPPRQGMMGMAPLLARLCRKRVIYVSCDPATLCRDLASLQQQGFTVKIIQPLDMFPQTHHIETVTVLEKSVPAGMFRQPANVIS